MSSRVAPDVSPSPFSESPPGGTRRFHLSAGARKLGRALLDQQMWCFGRDVSRAAGNLLVEYGFSKEPPPEGINISSRYTLDERESGRGLRLWGFGILYSETDVGAVFLQRRKFTPRSVPDGCTAGVWRAPDMPKCPKPRTKSESETAWRLLAGACAWLSGYEAWVREASGAEYREKCVAAWPKKSVPPEEMVEAWMRLARTVGGGAACEYKDRREK